MNMKVFLLLALVSVTLATRTFIDCSCSPSTRGYSRAARDELGEELKDLREREADIKAEQPNDAALSQLATEAEDKWNGCVKNFSYEECVNADAGMRYKNGQYDTTFCKFDRTTWRNGDKPECHKAPEHASTDANIVAGKPEVASAAPPKATAKSSARTPPPGAANAALPIPEEKPVSGSTEVNENEPAVDITSPTVATAKETPEPKKTMNEGCVAVEHLAGYKLQHPTHLRRNVLCANGFCATPNHAIIVDGKWTSMKRLCAAEWDCVPSVKWVNNLLVTANRRAEVGRITVTPYDLRFPRVAVWVVQIAEQVLNLLGAPVVASFVVLGATLVAVNSRS